MVLENSIRKKNTTMIIKIEEATENLEQEREFLVKEMMERCESTIKENEVVREIMEGVCW